MSEKVTNRFVVLLGERKKRISDVARETGISRTTLTHLYYGDNRAISFETLSRLCGYFQCEVGDILIRRKEP